MEPGTSPSRTLEIENWWYEAINPCCIDTLQTRGDKTESCFYDKCKVVIQTHKWEWRSWGQNYVLWKMIKKPWRLGTCHREGTTQLKDKLSFHSRQRKLQSQFGATIHRIVANKRGQYPGLILRIDAFQDQQLRNRRWDCTKRNLWWIRLTSRTWVD